MTTGPNSYEGSVEESPGSVPAQGPLTDVRTMLSEGTELNENEHTVLIA